MARIAVFGYHLPEHKGRRTRLLGGCRVRSMVSIARWSALDTLHDAHFRRLWLAGLCVNVGRWLDFLVLGWLVLDMTGSAFMVGVAAFCRFAPMIVFGLFAGLLIASVTWLFAPQIVAILFGEGYRESAVILRVFAPVVVFSFLHYLTSGALVAMGRELLTTLTLGIGAAVCIVLGFIYILAEGARAAGLIKVVAEGTSFAIQGGVLAWSAMNASPSLTVQSSCLLIMSRTWGNWTSDLTLASQSSLLRAWARASSLRALFFSSLTQRSACTTSSG